MKWHPIKTAPYEKEVVVSNGIMVFNAKKCRYSEKWYIQGWSEEDSPQWCGNEPYLSYPEPTHWMPLPKPPKKGGE